MAYLFKRDESLAYKVNIIKLVPIFQLQNDRSLHVSDRSLHDTDRWLKIWDT